MRLSEIAAHPGQVEQSSRTRSPAGAHAVLRLQRSAGNRAVTSLITAAPVQRMKSGEDESATIKANLYRLLDGSVKDLFAAVRAHHGLSEDDMPTSEQVWKYAEREYRANHDKGVKYWKSVRSALAGLDSAAAAEEERKKSEAYDRRFAAGYEFAGLGDSGSFVGTKGLSADPKARWPYHNEIFSDGSRHRITALRNHGKLDGNGEQRLPNSEILWQQLKAAVDDPSGLEGITRSSIVNMGTLVTLYMAYPNGELPGEDPREWRAGTEEFFAVLGTENAKSAAFLLIDHAHVLRSTIDVIRTSKSSIEVPFVPVRES